MANLKTLASFGGRNGDEPETTLLADAAGNLYGTTTAVGANYKGAVFRINIDPKSPTGFNSTPTLIASFSGPNGDGPSSGLIADTFGNLYGTTKGGGADGDGTLFEIARDLTSPTGYSSTPTTVVTFNGANGYIPAGNLHADAAGDLYGVEGDRRRLRPGDGVQALS